MTSESAETVLAGVAVTGHGFLVAAGEAWLRERFGADVPSRIGPLTVIRAVAKWYPGSWPAFASDRCPVKGCRAAVVRVV